MFPVLRPTTLNLYTKPMGQTLSKPVQPAPAEIDSEDDIIETETVVQTPTGARPPQKTNGAVVLENATANIGRKANMAANVGDTGTDIPEGKLFKCPLCELSFGYSYNLGRHYRQKHSPKTEPSAQEELAAIRKETDERVQTVGVSQKPPTEKAKQTKTKPKKRTVESDEHSTSDENKENIAPTKRTNKSGLVANVRSNKVRRITEEHDIVHAEQLIKELLQAQEADNPYIYHTLALAESGNGSVQFHICNKCIGINQLLDQIRNYNNKLNT